MPQFTLCVCVLPICAIPVVIRLDMVLLTEQSTCVHLCVVHLCVTVCACVCVSLVPSPLIHNEGLVHTVCVHNCNVDVM